MHKEVYEAELVNEIKDFIWKRSGSMFGTGVSIGNYSPELGEKYFLDFLKRHQDTFLLRGESILRHDMLKGI